MTIRARIVAGVTVLTAIVFVLAGLASAVNLRRGLIAAVDQQITTDARGVVQGLPRGLEGGFGRRQEQAIDSVFERRAIAIMFLPDEGDPVVIPAGTFEDPDPLPDIDPRAVEVGRVVTAPSVDGTIRYRVAAHEIGPGTIVLANSLARTDAAVRRHLRTLTLVGLGAVLLAGAGTALVVRRGMRPVDDMIATAEKVGDGTLSERVPVKNAGTEVGHLATAINGMLGRVEGAMAIREASEERLRRFASDASHELRTPLTSILGYSELYRHGGDDPDQVARSFDRIEDEGRRMARMLEDLLLLTRLDHSRGLAHEPVDLRQVVEEMTSDARAVEPGRLIDVRLPERQVMIRGDADRLRQVVANILANVREHTDATDAVAVDLAIDGGSAVLSVADEGPGMKPDIAKAAFERFARGGPAGAGSGLGLAIVKAIVEAHGGTVDLRSSPGAGTTIEVTIPVAEV